MRIQDEEGSLCIVEHPNTDDPAPCPPSLSASVRRSQCKVGGRECPSLCELDINGYHVLHDQNVSVLILIIAHRG
jgi:hypothetical protein